MWLMTESGFVSVVCPRSDGGRGREIEVDRVMVRSRDRQHLERLRAHPRLAHAEISETPGADYPFRLFADKAVFADVVRDMVLSVGYDNFKNSVARGAKTEADQRYLHALHDVWQAMRDGLQRWASNPSHYRKADEERND